MKKLYAHFCLMLFVEIYIQALTHTPPMPLPSRTRRSDWFRVFAGGGVGEAPLYCVMLPRRPPRDLVSLAFLTATFDNGWSISFLFLALLVGSKKWGFGLALTNKQIITSIACGDGLFFFCFIIRGWDVKQDKFGNLYGNLGFELCPGARL
ncbi:hypothetical protein B0T21DRAFT_100328 [Apiosordaria backusii]|uniref:Uncharacterized protein n=1 Tax=Apiosordaria backusii TaxID=314023 RepID=A0AA40ETN3_9PEZI|nr:hypothetical protein B0T21DRAFT_100328 [Apiosordaria backusii]